MNMTLLLDPTERLGQCRASYHDAVRTCDPGQIAQAHSAYVLAIQATLNDPKARRVWLKRDHRKRSNRR